MYLERYLNQIPMNSGWATEAQFAASGCIASQWSSAPEEGGVVLSSSGNDVICDGGRECRNVLVIGATGSGKSRRIIIPSLLRTMTAKNKRSLVIYDVKGELEPATLSTAQRCGYRVLRIDFRDPRRSDGWNPLAKANELMKAGKSEEAWKLVEDIMAIIFSDGEGSRIDAFWRTTSASIFRACVDVIWHNKLPATMESIIHLSSTIPANSYDADQCKLYKLIDRIANSNIAASAISAVRNASDATRGNILAAYNAYVSCMASRHDVLHMISCSSSSIAFGKIGEEPTVLYISLPDDSTTTGTLQGIVLRQLEQELNECALRHGGTLPVRTEIYIDELCNILPALSSLPHSITIARSRGIRYVLAIQSYSQLQSVYGNSAETIAANCATWMAVYIPKDEVFREKLSALCGRNAMGELLITPSQLADIPFGRCIVLRERCHPYCAPLEDLSEVVSHLNASLPPLPRPHGNRRSISPAPPSW